MPSSTQTKVQQFFTQYHPHTYKRGEIILQPENNPLGAFYIQEGYVRQYAISPQGVDINLHIFVPNSFFPMTWVLADIDNRYYYEALTNVTVYSAPKDAVVKFLQEDTEVLMDLTKRVFTGLDKVLGRIEFLTSGRAYEKLSSILLYLARHFGTIKNGKTVITPRFTHREIASLAGLSRETTSREWEQLKAKGIISTLKGAIVIEDIKKLKGDLSHR